MESITRSLAGRIAILSLLPLSLHELEAAGISSDDSYIICGGDQGQARSLGRVVAWNDFSVVFDGIQ